MRRAIAALSILVLLAAGVWVISRSRVADAPLPPVMSETAARLRMDVEALCAIGERSTLVPGSLAKAAELIERALRSSGHVVEHQTYFVEQDATTVSNVIAEVAGEDAKDVVVIGAHYDAVEGTVGADDNASGVAAMLELARRFAGTHPRRTLRFIAFANEEPPHFQTEDMGSLRYARRCHDRGETVAAMLSLEMLGYYDERPGSQQYPALLAPLFPDRANFIAFAGNLRSRGLVRRSVRAFQRGTRFPVESAALPELVSQVGWSDQWSFWRFGWPGLMVTDTALFRNPHYHTAGDVPETLDYERMAHVVDGLTASIEELAGVTRRAQ